MPTRDEQNKRPKKKWVGAFLVIVAIIIYIISFPFFLISLFWKRDWKIWFFDLATSLDQTGGVMYNTLYNYLFFRGPRLGNPDETISSVVGKNREMGSLTVLGWLLSDLLDWIDPGNEGHSIDAIEDDEKSY